MNCRTVSPSRFVSRILACALTMGLAFGPLPYVLPAHAQQQLPPRPPAPQPASEPDLLSPTEKAEKAGTAVRMSLKDVTKLALQNNLDIAISDTNEEMYQQRILGAYGSYDPEFVIGVGVSSRKSPNTNLATASTSGTFFNQAENAYWNARFVQNLRTGGGVQFDFNTQRDDTTSSFQLFTPSYRPTMLLQFSQPLWRNFRTDQIRTNIKLVNLDLKINDSQFKQRVVDTTARIQSLYWDLVNAIRDYEIRRESVKLADITLENNKKKVEIGTLAPIGITEARADKSSREVEMIQSEERIFSVQNSLRALISNDRNAEIWKQTIIPTETPEFKEVKVALDDAIDTALRNRPEIEQLAIRLQKNQISYDLDMNEKKWQVDLVASFGAVGIAGPQTTRVDPITGQLVNSIAPQYVGGMGHAYKTIFTEGLTNWTTGVAIRIPLKNTALESSLAQLKIAKRQELMNQKVLEQQVIVDIRNAVQALETNKRRVDTAKVARELAEEQLDGETKRFQAGLTENFRVLTRQRELSFAQGAELAALIAYKKSEIDLHRAMYTLLEANDFEVAKASSENVPGLK